MNEKSFKPSSGYLMLILTILVFAFTVFGLIALRLPVFAFGFLWLVALPGFFFVYPNSSRVLTLFGTYKGTVKTNGFYWVNPFFIKAKIFNRCSENSCR